MTLVPHIHARRALLAALVLAAGAGRALACDVCAVYTATEMRENRLGLRLGVAEQFTNFGTLQEGSEEVENPAGERLRSAITQVLVGYRVHPRLGFQVTVPIVSRTFRRLEGEHTVSGDETGPGDVSLLADVLALEHVTERSVLRMSVVGGLKLPSGDAGRLAEELAEDEHDHEEASGIHGHDLALGTGSVDGVAGARLFWSWQRFFVTATGQYVVRRQGAFDYTYANELTWTGGPGAFVLLGHDHSLGLQAVVSGETKGNDSLAGEKLHDTAITALYAGPGLTFTWGTSLGAEVAADLPVVQHNSALQIVPDYRVRGGLVWSF